MDWNNILAGAIYGAIGGGAGALIGGLTAAIFRNSQHRQMITVALTAGLAVLGMNLAEPILSPYIGKFLPQRATGSDLAAQIEAEFDKANDPLINAIFAKERNLKSQIVAELIETASAAPNGVAARQSAFSLAYSKVSSKFSYYLKRGRPEDLIEFTSKLVDGLEVLAPVDPEFCYTYLYNPGGLVGYSIEQVKAKFGVEQHQRQQEAAAQVVDNALPETAPYDVTIAAAVVERAGANFRAEIGDAGIAMVTGARHPENRIEAQLACEGTIHFYREILADENAGSALVHLYSQNG